jgi:hypothetical protein
MDIDRDALTKLALDLFEASMLWGRGDDIPEPNIEVFVGAVLALMRPVEGVTLTPEEARIVRWLLMFWGVDDKRERAATPPSRESINALAARLQAGHE